MALEQLKTAVANIPNGIINSLASAILEAQNFTYSIVQQNFVELIKMRNPHTITNNSGELIALTQYNIVEEISMAIFSIIVLLGIITMWIGDRKEVSLYKMATRFILFFIFLMIWRPSIGLAVDFTNLATDAFFPESYVLLPDMSVVDLAKEGAIGVAAEWTDSAKNLGIAIFLLLLNIVILIVFAVFTILSALREYIIWFIYIAGPLLLSMWWINWGPLKILNKYSKKFMSSAGFLLIAGPFAGVFMRVSKAVGGTAWSAEGLGAIWIGFLGQLIGPLIVAGILWKSAKMGFSMTGVGSMAKTVTQAAAAAATGGWSAAGSGAAAVAGQAAKSGMGAALNSASGGSLFKGARMGQTISSMGSGGYRPTGMKGKTGKASDKVSGGLSDEDIRKDNDDDDGFGEGEGDVDPLEGIDEIGEEQELEQEEGELAFNEVEDEFGIQPEEDELEDEGVDDIWDDFNLQEGEETEDEYVGDPLGSINKIQSPVEEDEPYKYEEPLEEEGGIPQDIQEDIDNVEQHLEDGKVPPSKGEQQTLDSGLRKDIDKERKRVKKKKQKERIRKNNREHIENEAFDEDGNLKVRKQQTQTQETSGSTTSTNFTKSESRAIAQDLGGKAEKQEAELQENIDKLRRKGVEERVLNNIQDGGRLRDSRKMLDHIEDQESLEGGSPMMGYSETDSRREFEENTTALHNAGFNEEPPTPKKASRNKMKRLSKTAREKNLGKDYVSTDKISNVAKKSGYDKSRDISKEDMTLARPIPKGTSDKSLLSRGSGGGYQPIVRETESHVQVGTNWYKKSELEGLEVTNPEISDDEELQNMDPETYRELQEKAIKDTNDEPI